LDNDIGKSLEELVGMVLNAGALINITGFLFRINKNNGVIDNE